MLTPGETNALPTATPAQTPAYPASAPALDKWSLWANGTQLRGANIWQRIVVPELDGLEFLGDGYVGPPITQDDLDALAALGANVVDLSHPGLFTERPPYVLDEQVQANLDRLIEMAAQADLFVVITFRTGPGRSRLHLLPRRRRRVVRPRPADRVGVDRRRSAGRVGRHVELHRRTLPGRPGRRRLRLDVRAERGGHLPRRVRPGAVLSRSMPGSLLDWNQFYPRIVDGIRQVDEETPILVGAQGWEMVRWLPALEPVDDPRIVYMVHQYEPQDSYTHQGRGRREPLPGEFDVDYDGERRSFRSGVAGGPADPGGGLQAPARCAGVGERIRRRALGPGCRRVHGRPDRSVRSPRHEPQPVGLGPCLGAVDIQRQRRELPVSARTRTTRAGGQRTCST